MKFTPSAQFLALAKGSAVKIVPKVYMRKTPSLSGSIVGYSGWTDVTEYIELDSLPDIHQRIEYNLGQFTSDTIKLTGAGIQWWKANFLTTTVRLPNTLSGLAAWYKADAIQNLVDGNSIDTILDFSGNNNTQTQSGGSNKPTYKTAIINSLPVIRCDGTSDYMSAPSASSLNSSGDITVIVCVRPSLDFASCSAWDGMVFKGNFGTSNPQYGWTRHDAAGGKPAFFTYNNSGTAFAVLPPIAILTNTNYIMTGIKSGATVSAWVNGANNAMRSDFTGTLKTGSDALYFGVNRPASGEYFVGDIAEVIIYNRALTATEQLGVESYLASKYAITFPGAISDDYVEIKIEYQIEGASDIAYMFTGFVRKSQVESVELEDSITFEAYTAEDVGSQLAAEQVSTQFINPNIDGASTSGLVLQSITQMFVKSANVTGYVLNVGVHTITYDYNGGTRRAKLDNGAWVTLVNGTNTLGDSDASATDTQRLQVYVPSTAALAASSSLIVDYVIVLNAGQTLPYQFYQNIHARTLLTKLYNQIGITTQTFDTMEMLTYDGLPRVLFLDTPPNDPTVTGTRKALASDGTYLYVCVGSNIYRRDMTTGVYTYLTTNPSAGEIKRIWVAANKNHLWMYYESTTQRGKMRRLDLSTLVLSSEILLYASDVVSNWYYSVEMVNYAYDVGSKYGILYTNTSTGKLRFIDGNSLSDTDLAPTIPFGSSITCHHIFDKGSGKYWYRVYNSTDYEYYEIRINQASGAWIDGGSKLGTLPQADRAAYSVSADRIFFVNVGAGKVQSTPSASYSPTDHLSSIGTIDSIIAGGDGVCYFTTEISAVGKVYSASGTAAAVQIGTGAYTQNYSLAWTDRLHGVHNPTSGSDGRIFQCSSSLIFLIRNANLSGMNVTDALRRVLNAYLLIGGVSMAKKAFIYRRGDNTGAPQTTGNTISITVNEASQLNETTDHVRRADMVKVSNNINSVTYDGIAFNSAVLNNRYVVEITNAFIPDEYLKDIAFYAWQFFKKALNLYPIELGAYPMFQYEPFDGASVTFNTTNIQKTASGPIYAASYGKDGTMRIEVLL